MMATLNEKIKALSIKRQDSIQRRANELIAEEMTLRDLRLALKMTQEHLSTVLHIKQDGISRLEKRSDMLISTLDKYIRAMGGTLKLTAEFPDRPAVEIHGIAAIQSH